MHETAEDLRQLQRVLDVSHSLAGGHLRSIFTAEQRPSAARLVDELAGVFVLHLATTTASGNPFVAPIDGLFYRGRICFSVPAEAVRAAHLRARPGVSAAVTRGHEFCLIAHGRAREIRASDALFRGFADYCRELYGPVYDPERAARGFSGWIDPQRLFCLLRA